MALNLKMADAAVNGEADALDVLAATGYIRIYGGTQPATADTATGETLLAELRLGATAFGDAVAGVLTANAITKDSAANATGTATWFRVLKSDGTTSLWDGSAGVGTFNLNLGSAAIQINAEVTITSMVHTVTK